MPVTHVHRALSREDAEAYARIYIEYGATVDIVSAVDGCTLYTTFPENAFFSITTEPGIEAPAQGNREGNRTQTANEEMEK